MFMVFLTAPACLLSFYLAFLCYKRSFYRHTLILASFGICMLLVTVGILGFGYLVWAEMGEELARA